MPRHGNSNDRYKITNKKGFSPVLSLKPPASLKSSGFSEIVRNSRIRDPDERMGEINNGNSNIARGLLEGIWNVDGK